MSKFGSLGAGAKPFRVFIKLDGKQIIDKNGKAFFVDVHAEDGAVGRRFDREQRDVNLALAKEGQESPTQTEINYAKCAALTDSWYLPLTTWIWGQAWVAAVNHANFIKRSAKGSTPTQSGPSETAAS